MRLITFPKAQPFTIAIFLACLACSGASSVITSKFTPSQSDVNRSAYYKITIKGGELLEPIRLPKIPGLDFISEGKQLQFSSINGSMIRQTVLIYRVEADEPGEYTLPSFTAKLSDGTATVPEASISFIHGSAEQSTQEKPIGLELKLPKERFYVGETVPCQIKLFVETGIRAGLVSSEPSQESDAFIVNAAGGAPKSAIAHKNGVQYQEVFWNYTLTPIKAGVFPLNFEYIIEAALPSQNDSNFFSSHPLGSSIFNTMLNARRFKLETGKDSITVESLPTEGCPDNFTGAIGEFIVFQKLSTHSVEIGEPITLTLSISGQGNFDRIQAPPIPTNGQWKVYEPKRSFTPTDSLGYKGIETIEYVLIPQTQAIDTTPRIEFSYFDAQEGVYRSAVADPVPITVTLAEYKEEAIKSLEPAEPLQEQNNTPPAKQTSTAPPKTGLIDIDTEIGRGSQSLKPALLQPIFWLIQGVMGACISAWYFIRMRTIKLSEDSAYAHRVFSKKAVKKHLLLAKGAAENGNATTFFAEAQRAIQATLSKAMGKKANALTWQEIKAFLTDQGASDATIEETRAFFEGIEALRFGGQSIETGELSTWIKRLHTLIESLQK